MSDAERYAWVDDGERLSAACFTAVTGVAADEVVRRFGADPATERTATFDEAFNDTTGSVRLVFVDLDGAVLVAENNGWQGSRDEVVEAVSRHGLVASVYWSVNADMSFLYAEDGVVVARFDPLLVEHPWSGSDPESVRDRARDLPFGVRSPRAASLALAERLTGVGLEPGWLEQPHRCVDVPGTDELRLPSLDEYGSVVRQGLRAWWRSFRGKA